MYNKYKHNVQLDGGETRVHWTVTRTRHIIKSEPTFNVKRLFDSINLASNSRKNIK